MMALAHTALRRFWKILGGVALTLASASSGLEASAGSEGTNAATHIFAARTIPAGILITERDIRSEPSADGTRTEAASIVGFETRTVIYVGRRITPADVRAPALVARNDHVEMRFNEGILVIRTEGRALERGAAGERVRVMNLASRSVVTATVMGHGIVRVGEKR